MQGLVAEVLAAWREAERVASEHPTGPEHDAAQFAVDRLRTLYFELTSGRPGHESDNEARALLERARLRRPHATGA